MQRRLIIGLALVPLLVACDRRTVEQLRAEVVDGQFCAAAETVEALYPGDDNALIRSFELGLVRFAQGDYRGALDVLQMADAAVMYFRSDDFLNGLSKLTLNDTMSSYDGAAFEHIQVQYYRALAMVLLAQWQEGVYCPVVNGTLPEDGMGVSERYGMAIDFARRLVLREIGLTQKDGGRHRYQDDPFGRVLLAALVAAADNVLSSDLQAANACLLKAAEVYGQEASTLTADPHLRYEARPDNQVFTTLLHRLCQHYDAGGFQALAPKLPPPHPIRLGDVDPATLQHPADLPTGYGSILVMHHAGFVAEPQRLTIGLITHQNPAARKYPHRFNLGGLHFWVEGPGAGICNLWIGLPIPQQLAEIIAPGGISFISFEMPVHDVDMPVPPPAAVALILEGDGTTTVDLEVVSDLDAYARASLKDHQPGVLLRTLCRSLVKQGLVAGGAAAVKQHGGKYKNAAALGVNLIGSALASATEVADLRSINLLPDRIEAVLVDVPAGTHRLTLHAPGGSVDLGAVTVKAGRLVIVPARTYR